MLNKDNNLFYFDNIFKESLKINNQRQLSHYSSMASTFSSLDINELTSKIFT